MGHFAENLNLGKRVLPPPPGVLEGFGGLKPHRVSDKSCKIHLYYFPDCHVTSNNTKIFLN